MCCDDTLPRGEFQVDLPAHEVAHLVDLAVLDRVVDMESVFASRYEGQIVQLSKMARSIRLTQ